DTRQTHDLRELYCVLNKVGGRVHDLWAFQRGRASLTLTVAGARVCDDAHLVRRWGQAGKRLV
ncbi:LysR family transcriptional regulator, partial [Pseudomonas aeruginosa]